MYDVAIIGCGIVGAAAAYELSKYRLSVAIIEKENDVSMGATRANSAIIHAGYDPEPGTLMAKLNAEGNALTKEICQKLDVPYNQCGSLVLAFSEAERETLKELLRRGNENGVPGLTILSGDDVRKMEPEISREVVAALHAPSAAIVSPWELALAMAQTAVSNGAELFLNSPVTEIQAVDGGYRITAGESTVEARFVLNAAGVHSDTVHNLAAKPAFKIVPDRGEYYLLDKSEGTRVKTVVFQCPTPHGKGVLVAPTVHGNLIVGPSNERIPDPEDTANTAAGLGSVVELALKSIPGVRLRESIRNFSGVRAASDQPDFIIGETDSPGFIDLAGIKSPGLTAAPAAAKMAVEILQKCGLAVELRDDFKDERKRVRFNHLSAEERAGLVRENPAYGRVVCRCETVTEGEIIDVIRMAIPPVSIDGVKRRCSTGMGRCQGGFCGPRVMEILSRELNVSPLLIPQDMAGAELLTGETKGGGLDA